MDENIYKTPEADLTNPTDLTSDNDLYVVSPSKMTILLISTVGIYGVYWMYKNWKKFNDKHNLGVWPIARALFSVFFIHQLLSHVDDKLKEKNIEFSWNPSLLATIYVLIAVFNFVTDRLPDYGMISVYLAILSMLFFGVKYVIYLKSQKAINASQNDPNGLSNSEYTLANYSWIIFGTCLWIFFITFFLHAYGVVSFDIYNQLFYGAL